MTRGKGKTSSPANAEAKQGSRWQKGQSGNPAGKPVGTRHRATLAAEALLDGEAEKLTRKAIDLALSGDGPALRLCVERIIPARRDRIVSVTLPTFDSCDGALSALSALTAAVAGGELTPSEASDLAGLIGVYVKTLETRDLEQRLAALEQRAGPMGG